jgi:4-hydroxybenzoate polyprenyltransferase
MGQYIKAIRLPAGLFTALTVMAGFNLAGLNYSSSTLLAIVTWAIFSATVATNDYQDRNRDHLAGKSFAYNHPLQFKWFCVILWAFALGLMTGIDNPSYLALCFLMILFSLFYHKTEKITGLSMTVVGITVAIPASFSLTEKTSLILVVFVGFLFVIMCVREILKDFADIKVDSHAQFGKATLPVKLGMDKSITAIRIGGILAAMLLSVLIAKDTDSFTKATSTLALVFLVTIFVTVKKDQHDIRMTRILLDFALGLIIFAVAILWPLCH